MAKQRGLPTKKKKTGASLLPKNMPSPKTPCVSFKTKMHCLVPKKCNASSQEWHAPHVGAVREQAQAPACGFVWALPLCHLCECKAQAWVQHSARTSACARVCMCACAIPSGRCTRWCRHACNHTSRMSRRVMSEFVARTFWRWSCHSCLHMGAV